MKSPTELAYEEIFDVIEKHKDICVFDVSFLKRQSKNHLHGAMLRDHYGLDIDPKEIDSTSWVRLKNDAMGIGLFGEKHSRTISWSDDGTQPEDELLLKIGFPTGAYIFGQDYPVSVFRRFYAELKEFGPKYSDMTNSALYFALDNAKDVFNNYDSIFKKYREIYSKEAKERRAQELRTELAKLESEAKQ